MNLHRTRDDFLEDRCLKREIYSMPLISLISLGYFHTDQMFTNYCLMEEKKKLNITIDQIL